MYGVEIGRQLVRLAVMIAVVAALLGGLAVWGAPRLWALIKPLLLALLS